MRGVDEEILQIFGAESQVTKHRGEHLFLQIEDDFRTWKVREDQVDVLAWVRPAAPKKNLTLNAGDRALLQAKFPYLAGDKEGLKMEERLSGDHLMLQEWMTNRDLSYDIAGSKFVMPTIVCQFVRCKLEPGEEAIELRQKAEQIVGRHFKKHGLLGLPIYSDHTDAAAHWTLLVLRKCRNEVQVRYYDSLDDENIFNRCIATDVLIFLSAEIPDMHFPDALPARTNTRSRQINGVDCGVFVMWFWEGELRRFIGEGWSCPFPSTSQKGPIWKMRTRLVGLVKQVQKHAAAKEKADGKAKGTAAASTAGADAAPKSAQEVLDAQGAEVTADVMQKVLLKDLAEKSHKEGSVPFYGCARCRGSRGGCIDYKCNPDKFNKHYAEHPDAYDDSKVLKIEVLKEMKNKDLVGGGSQVGTNKKVE